MKKEAIKNKERVFKSGEVMSMLEQINDGIEVIGEQHGEVIGRLNKLEGKVNQIQDDVTEIKH